MKKILNNRMLSLVLALALLFATLVVPNTITYATEGEQLTINGGMVLSKTVTKVPDKDNVYKIVLYAYATGKSNTIETKVSHPVDIVMIVDQSSSMSDYLSGNTTRLSATKTAISNFIESVKKDATENNVNHRLALVGYSNGPTSDSDTNYNGTELFIGSDRYNYANSRLSDGSVQKQSYELYNGRTNSTYYSASQLYEKVGNEYLPLDVSRVGGIGSRSYTYHFSTGNQTSNGAFTTPSLSKDIYRSVFSDCVASDLYSSAFQDVTTTSGYNNIKASVSELDDVSNTYPTAGIEMANGIFEAYKSDYVSEKRQKIIIFFTDGRPAPSGSNDFLDSEGNSAIAAAKKAKDLGVTVYSVGVFSDANASTPEKLPSNSGNINKSNRFLYLISSYYPSATDMANTGAINTNLKPKYYMTANNTDSLNNVFTTISEYVHTEYTEVKLTSAAQIKDVITPYFAGPTNVEQITKYYQACIDVDKNDNRLRIFDEEHLPANDLEVSLVNYEYGTGEDSAIVGERPNDTVIATNFNYRDNWCGVDENTKVPHGKRVVIEFEVTVRDGFLGGNGVPTNQAISGLYDDDGELLPGYEFPIPEPQDVPVENFKVKVKPVRKDVYLYGDVSKKDMLVDATIDVVHDKQETGDTLYLDKENYGLPEWRINYINVDLSYSTELFSKVTADTSYYLTGTVSPKNSGTYGAESDTSDETPIWVYVPRITYQDSVITSGNVPDYSDNLVSVEWVHIDGKGNETVSDKMIGKAPSLNIEYEPEGEAVFDNSHVKVKAVTMDVDGDGDYETDITDRCVFKHKDCYTIGCDFDSEKDNFVVHVTGATGNIVITNTVYTSQSLSEKDMDDKFEFVYHISNTSGTYKQTVIVKGTDSVKITGLPLGEYVIVQDTAWSNDYTCVAVNPQRKTIVGESATDNNNTFLFSNYKKSNRNLKTAWDYIKNIFTTAGVVSSK